MQIHRSPGRHANGMAAASLGAAQIRNTIQADLMIATVASRFGMIEALPEEKAITWSRVTVFHLVYRPDVVSSFWSDIRMQVSNSFAGPLMPVRAL